MEYSLRKCRRILRSHYKLFQKKRHTLTENEQKLFEGHLRALDRAILDNDKGEARKKAKEIEAFAKERMPKSLFDHGRELVYALAFAIVVAFLIRQFWFELYEVPTGSMRPTVEELDRMVVSKTTFGINWPFRKKPLLFSEEAIERTGIIVFTVEDMDVSDGDMLYFNIIPGKKRFIKRCVAKPGDTLYFYGGQIYALDKNDQSILLQTDAAYLKREGIEKIDHIPFITFDGKSKVGRPTSQSVFGAVNLFQMDLPVAKMELKSRGEIEGVFFNGQEWVKDQVSALKSTHDKPVSYSDLWGIGNYAMARLLTKGQVQQFYGHTIETENAPLFLELHHTPNLTYPRPELRQGDFGLIQPMMTPFVALLPLQDQHLDALRHHLYTARFYVKNGRAFRYHEGIGRPQRPEYDPKLPTIPDGCYEFYYGLGYKVHFGGIRTKLPDHHPLYSKDPELLRKLFNLGIGFNTVFEPIAPNQPYNPQRFAYYREGDLYVMGGAILKKDDPTLLHFVQKEKEKQNSSGQERPYIAFIDKGPPLKKDGSLDTEFVKAFGLKVPDDGVVALGDNYAMSADSRDFGFVPVANLRGSPSFTFWPPGPRIGPLPQPSYPWCTLPNCIVWGLAILVIALTLLWLRKRNKRSLFPEEK